MTGARTSPTARVAVSTRPLWTLRLRAEAIRYLVGAAAVLGLVATVRIVVSPPSPVFRKQTVTTHVSYVDRAAEALATGFVRRYLTWNASDPEASARALERYFGSGFEPDGGLELPGSGRQQVEWAEVVQVQPTPHRGYRFTVAAQTGSVGPLYVSVGVDRSASGTLSLAGYPAFVGAPPYRASLGDGAGRAIADSALVTVVQRALRNFLSGSAGDLEADLVHDVHVPTPTMPLSLETMQRPYWAAAGVVLAIVQAHDARGVRYTLAYELGVAREQGRWEITEVQSA